MIFLDVTIWNYNKPFLPTVSCSSLSSLLLAIDPILTAEDIHVMHASFWWFYYAPNIWPNGRLNTQNEAAKRGLERLEKQMKVCSYYLLFNMYAFLNKSDVW